MIEMIFIGVILNDLDLLHGGCLFAYITAFIMKMAQEQDIYKRTHSPIIIREKKVQKK